MTPTPPTCTPVPDRLADRVAIVSGGASGIGRATCARLTAEGACVVVTDIDATGGEETANLSDKAVFTHLDVTSRESWDTVTAMAVETFGGLDILVNCAAICPENTAENTRLDDWRRTLSVNVDGTFFGCQAAVAAMKNRGGGAIVNISSTSGYHGDPDLFAYVASKGAVRALSKEVAAYCGSRGYAIRCNSVHPGVVNTPMVSGFFAASDEDPSSWTDSQAINRMATPDEIAALIAFLVSDESSFSTGAEFVIDGGSTAGHARAWK